MDGVLPMGVETGLMKAQGRRFDARGPPSQDVVASRFPTLEGRAIRMDLGRAQGLSYYFVGGGLPIVVENQLIGAMGVGGGNMDEMCAYTALTKVLGPQKTAAAACGARRRRGRQCTAGGGGQGGGGGRGGEGSSSVAGWGLVVNYQPPTTNHQPTY
jgi:hypothetical protein